MNVIAINGSPRKKWNTATLLTHALQGAESKGAATEMVHLYDLDYKGCISCFECKKIGGKNYGRCAVKDGLTPLLERVGAADAVLLGTPVYFGAETGMMRSFFERFAFPYLTYTPGYESLFIRKMPTAMIYTMNIPEQALPEWGYDVFMERMRGVMARTFGSCEMLASTDTCQFDDYSKYLSTCWDAAAKARRREEVFPEDCARAFALGERLVAAAGN
ncbi:NADPH-dependent FMN reductase [Solidesulfovibrio carbinoliphilus subsp. oakridgensis]|uniref:NADPH-dependent FMN reductase n=1 Tax=Solidesulfovibrio carbinoliphilus subsp. oakridgensis TaxID=694327 RepID=G7Q5I8_9BACT|nr:flavodoxin family protein [Solidesulfovibrio carbinoliphilus]EHJ48989.1 NADPH-dependent FMN reductase [Solidesulfovibrio carbinoliphilus subsp. oakridgensis]